MLTAYLKAHPITDRIAVKDLHRAFLDTIPAEDRAAWGRSRFIAELGKAGLSVALIDRVTFAVPA